MTQADYNKPGMKVFWSILLFVIIATAAIFVVSLVVDWMLPRGGVILPWLLVPFFPVVVACWKGTGPWIAWVIVFSFFSLVGVFVSILSLTWGNAPASFTTTVVLWSIAWLFVVPTVREKLSKKA
ncbi:hypothetical protein [Bradyrhizobium sp. SYSU BS000235]|uniref:hypothetical protein n=1 Tax=Bradyrhizobium sp. SYSU BS000235 TaxID=3411332 RepID=UPI003C75F2BB